MAAHTHEAPDDIVYVHAAWGGSGRLTMHLIEEHGMDVRVGTTVADLRLRHAEAHTQTLSTAERELISGQQFRDQAAALLRRLKEQLGSIEHTAFPPGIDQDAVMITTLDHVEEWLSMCAVRLARGEEL